MASVLICCTPAHGHVVPLLAVARDLVARGHDVRMLTGRAYARTVRAAGALHVPLPPEADLDVDHPDAVFPERAAMRPIPQIRFSVLEFFIRPLRPQAAALEAELAARPADVVLTEMLFLGALALVDRARATRPPIVVLGIFPLVLPDPDVAPYGLGVLPMRGPIGRLRNRVLERLAARLFAPAMREGAAAVAAVNGTSPDSFAVLDLPARADLLLQLSVPGFEYPRRHLPSSVRFIGPAVERSPGPVALPDWWGDLDGRTVVHVSQGTAANDDPTALIVPTMRALADDDVLVVASTGGRPVETLGPLPANSRAAEYLPYERLFTEVAVFVTNGGYGGLHFALRHGVPIVAAGTSEDKAETTARVQWSGVGIRLRTARPGPAAIRRAVRRVLTRPAYRIAAERLRDEIVASPGLVAVHDAVTELTRADR